MHVDVYLNSQDRLEKILLRKWYYYLYSRESIEQIAGPYFTDIALRVRILWSAENLRLLVVYFLFFIIP